MTTDIPQKTARVMGRHVRTPNHGSICIVMAELVKLYRRTSMPGKPTLGLFLLLSAQGAGHGTHCLSTAHGRLTPWEVLYSGLMCLRLPGVLESEFGTRGASFESLFMRLERAGVPHGLHSL